MSGSTGPSGPAVPPRITLVTLGVVDVVRSTSFYEQLGWHRSSASVDGVVSFFQLGANVLAVWGRDALAHEARVPVGTPGASALAINVATDDDVDATLAAAAAAGATILRPAADALEFDGRSGYFADPDGHPWEVAHNPGFPLDEHGQVTLP